VPEQDQPSSNFKRFRLAVTVAAALILGSFIVYQVGRDNTHVATSTGAVTTLATVLFVVAVMMRWRGPWRD
jgi:hypothetical protein